MKNNQLKIGIFCSSNPLARSKKPTDYAYLTSKGFEVYEHPQVRIRMNHFAGTIKERVGAIHSLLKDDTVDILMAYWGGANTNQILPYLDFELFKKYPKPIIGFSDTTALLLAVNKFAGTRTYMGPAGVTFDKPQPFEYSFDYFKRIVIDKEQEVLIKDSANFADDLYFLRPDSDHRIIQENIGRKIFRHGKAEGEAIGANLQTLLVLAGTKYFPDLKGKILFLEEDENISPSFAHRFFTHFSQAVDINTLSAICVGRFPSQCGFKEGNTEEIIYQDVFKDVNIPIIYNLDFGHTDPLFTVPIGVTAIINTEKNELRFRL